MQSWREVCYHVLASVDFLLRESGGAQEITYVFVGCLMGENPKAAHTLQTAGIVWLRRGRDRPSRLRGRHDPFMLLFHDVGRIVAKTLSPGKGSE